VAFSKSERYMTVPQPPLDAPGPVNLCLDLRTLQLGGPHGWVGVSDPECRLLKAFTASTDQRIDAALLLEHAGKRDDAAAKRALGVQLVRLRKKLAKVGAPAPTIKSIRGQGYQLCVSLEIRHFS
jgi:DNA-binding response OmpR family regulator